MNRLKEKYSKEVTPALMSKFNYKSVMQVPKVEKSLSTWVLVTLYLNSKALDAAVEELTNYRRSKTCCN